MDIKAFITTTASFFSAESGVAYYSVCLAYWCQNHKYYHKPLYNIQRADAQMQSIYYADTSQVIYNVVHIIFQQVCLISGVHFYMRSPFN